jgi:hypothetical protein
MPFSHLPPLLTSTFTCLASWLHKRSALHLPQLLLGVLFATGRRTVTSWFRAIAVLDLLGHCPEQVGHTLAQYAPALSLDLILSAPDIKEHRHGQSGKIGHDWLHEDESIEGKPKFSVRCSTLAYAGASSNRFQRPPSLG